MKRVVGILVVAILVNFLLLVLMAESILAHESIEGLVGLDHPGAGLGGRVFGL